MHLNNCFCVNFHCSCFGTVLEIIVMDVNACNKRLMSTAARYKDFYISDVTLSDIGQMVTSNFTWKQVDELLEKEAIRGLARVLVRLLVSSCAV